MTATAEMLRQNRKAKPPKLPQPKLLTFADYERLTPPNSGNYELHNGKILFMPSPLAPHQILSGNLFADIHVHIRARKLGVVIAAPMDVIFTPNDTIQPDILFIVADRLDIIDRQVKGAPDFIVEILSEGNTAKDMSYKKHIYESSGVREYWVVNLKKQILRQYENIEGEFFSKQFNIGDTVQSLVIEGFSLEINDLFN